MKAVVFSDLHLDFSVPDPIALPDNTDVLIVAGDVSAPVAKSMAWLHNRFPGVPVVYVAGNHDHYNQVYAESMDSGRRDAQKFPDIHFLENQEWVFGDVRFLGATLWTDFDLYGEPEAHAHYAWDIMNDFQKIYERAPDDKLLRFNPKRTMSLHAESRAWLRERLAVPFDGKTVVVTHHCPHPMSVAKEYQGDHLTPAFCSDLSAEIEEFQPDLWVHGHTHHSFDYIVPETTTRVVCNPRGYVKDYFNGRSVENMAFEPIKVVEI